VVTLFGDNIKALFGMSADGLAGETSVSRRLERKKLVTFAAPQVARLPNATTATVEDKFSTFAIDVDTASYTWTRRLVLEQRQLPPVDGVRVEEFVNAFDYGLPAPERAPFAVHVQGATSPFDETRTLLKVALQGRRVDESKRMPAHLVFLVDVSGSMSGPDRLPLAKRALEVLTRQLKPTDTVALVTYAGRAEVVLKPTGAARRDDIIEAIHSLQTGGGTNMGSGMELAYDLAVGQVQPNTTTRVIVLTDGDANLGRNQSAAQMLSAIQAHVDEGVTMTTVGFGLGNYKYDALEQLADKGNGQALYIDGEKAIDTVFRKNLTGTLEVIAKDVKVQVEFDPAVVKSYRLIGYENRDIADEDFRNDEVDAGELGAGHQVTALYELALGGGNAPLGVVRVRGLDPANKEPFELGQPIAREAVAHQLHETSADLRFAAAVALGADVLRGNTVGDWSLTTVANLAQGASEGRDERLEFVRVLRTAATLEGSARAAAYYSAY
jgi:Ca-activated chloride channel family protein